MLASTGKQGNREAQIQAHNVTVPSGIRALQHPDPSTHVFQLPGDVQGNASTPTYQDAGIVWAHLCFDCSVPASAAAQMWMLHVAICSSACAIGGKQAQDM